MLDAGTQSFIRTFEAALSAIVAESGHQPISSSASKISAGESSQWQLHTALQSWDASDLVSKGIVRASAVVMLINSASGDVVTSGEAQVTFEVWRLSEAQRLLIDEGYGAAPTHRQRDVKEIYESFAYALAEASLDNANLLPRWQSR